MVTDTKVIAGLLVLAVLMFVGFWFVEGMPIVG